MAWKPPGRASRCSSSRRRRRRRTRRRRRRRRRRRGPARRPGRRRSGHVLRGCAGAGCGEAGVAGGAPAGRSAVAGSAGTAGAAGCAASCWPGSARRSAPAVPGSGRVLTGVLGGVARRSCGVSVLLVHAHESLRSILRATFELATTGAKTSGGASVPGTLEPEPGPAVRAGAGPHVAAVPVRDRLDDREAEPRAGHRARLRGAVEAVEDVRQVLARRCRGPGRRPSPCPGASSTGDPAAGRAPLGGVVEQVGDRALQGGRRRR